MNYRNKARYSLLYMALPLMALVFLFSYMPLFGWIYAFYDYKAGIPLFQNEFVGLKFFKLIFSDKADMIRVMKNTLIFAFIGLALSPLPMVFAILMNEIRIKRFKSFIQTATTLPNFVSWIIVYSLTFMIFSTEGLLNQIGDSLGLLSNPTNILTKGDAVYWFQTALGVWKGLGWSAIVYVASISSIDQELYEAAVIDGAGRFKSAMHITLPSLVPTYLVLLILSIGNFLNVGLEQYLVYKNALTADNIEVLDLYVYQLGINNHDYSYGVAVGILKSGISIILLVIANVIAKRVRGSSIF
ncbi:ABC transporter permease [Paenibacillus glycanilyticus]|uniref:ABC transporter permease n=1 Tax=Paenibacillus glycanilyticus TaxID=126569 RepID=UPI003EC067BD